MTPPPVGHVCIGCAVCCRSYRVAFHWSETTAFPGGSVPVELTEPLRHHEVVMRGTNGADPICIAMTGTPGSDARCGIHGRHPSCCRAVQVGDDQCRRARHRHGLPDPTPTQVATALASEPRTGVPDGLVSDVSNGISIVI